jgi:hypothetical protein
MIILHISCHTVIYILLTVEQTVKFDMKCCYALCVLCCKKQAFLGFEMNLNSQNFRLFYFQTSFLYGNSHTTGEDRCVKMLCKYVGPL